MFWRCTRGTGTCRGGEEASIICPVESARWWIVISISYKKEGPPNITIPPPDDIHTIAYIAAGDFSGAHSRLRAEYVICSASPRSVPTVHNDAAASQPSAFRVRIRTTQLKTQEHSLATRTERARVTREPHDRAPQVVRRSQPVERVQPPPFLRVLRPYVQIGLDEAVGCVRESSIQA